jgi:hypothetical protein
MAEEALVDSDIADTVTLVKALDSRGDSPSQVVWHYYPDAAEWRLLIAGPTFDQLLPTSEQVAYQRVAEVLANEQVASLSIAKIMLVRTDYPLLMATRTLIGTGATGISRIHFRDNAVNGIFIKEMIVIRSS